jgi:hypothetical protein
VSCREDVAGTAVCKVGPDPAGLANICRGLTVAGAVSFTPPPGIIAGPLGIQFDGMGTQLGNVIYSRHIKGYVARMKKKMILETLYVTSDYDAHIKLNVFPIHYRK